MSPAGPLIPAEHPRIHRLEIEDGEVKGTEARILIILFIKSVLLLFGHPSCAFPKKKKLFLSLPFLKEKFQCAVFKVVQSLKEQSSDQFHSSTNA